VVSYYYHNQQIVSFTVLQIFDILYNGRFFTVFVSEIGTSRSSNLVAVSDYQELMKEQMNW